MENAPFNPNTEQGGGSWVKIAAAIVVLIIVGFIIYYYGGARPEATGQPQVQAPTSTGEAALSQTLPQDTTDAINQQLQGINTGDINADLQGINDQLKSL